MIDIEWLRKVCLPLPGVTEQIQWGNDLVLKVCGKMFAVAPLEPAPVCLSFKCSDESFAELTERAKLCLRPTSHARNGWPWNLLTPSHAVNYRNCFGHHMSGY